MIFVDGGSLLVSTASKVNSLSGQRVMLDVMLAAVTVYLLIAFSFATPYDIAIPLDSQSFRFPEWIAIGAAADTASMASTASQR
jgi:hypothetical protein